MIWWFIYQTSISLNMSNYKFDQQYSLNVNILMTEMAKTKIILLLLTFCVSFVFHSDVVGVSIFVGSQAFALCPPHLLQHLMTKLVLICTQNNYSENQPLLMLVHSGTG